LGRFLEITFYPIRRLIFSIISALRQPEEYTFETWPLSNPSSTRPKKLILQLFIDTLDEEVGSWNAEYQISPPTPPPGMLNKLYGVNKEEELPDAAYSYLDTDWDEQLFDPVAGPGFYLD
jgi:hypothetical protein